jgi:hypothetical protein
MREWHLTAYDPMAPRISADARSGRTNYNDDHTWHLRLGSPDEAAVGLETRFGGRVGLARLVPLWLIGRRQVFETQGYHSPPVLTAFAPDYVRLRAGLTYALSVTLEFWVMESQAVGGRFTVENTGDQPESLRLDITAQAMREQQSLQMFFLTLEDSRVALQMGRLPQFQPVLMMEGAAETATLARLSRSLELAPGQAVATRWVLAGLPERDASLGLAYRWLADADWDAHINQIEAWAAAAPQVETGRDDWDAALAWSQHLVQRCFLAATGSLPHPSFVSSRKTMQGFPAGGVHAAGFNSPWGGQTVMEALTIAASVSLAAPDLAKGMVRNFLAVQRDDGWIDAMPGLDGQRANVLAPPVLATLAYTVYHYTLDLDFLRECYSGLHAFFDRWFKNDQDRNRDGLPEWSHPAQGAFADAPTLAQNRRWGQGVDITTVQAPDLTAYLVREARILIRIAQILGLDDPIQTITPRYEALQAALNEMWDPKDGTFHYRDRDTHAWPSGEMVFERKGDQSLADRTVLPQPSRLILKVIGGLSRKPKLSCTLEGVDGTGNGTHETLEAEDFDWYRGLGSATSRTVWRELTHVKFSGLSRVFTVQGHTVDLTQHDQSLFMPLWSGTLNDDQVTQMVTMLTDPSQYWHEYGISGCPESNPAYDAAHVNGCGGVWPAWNARIGWALIALGYRREATDLFGRLLRAQIKSLREQHAFRSLYHPDTGEGLGDSDVLEGVVSWGWFTRLFGAFVLDSSTAMITDPFAFDGDTMTWVQHGVRVTRSVKGTHLVFPSGYEVDLPPDAESQIVRDPQAKAPAKPRGRRSTRSGEDLLPDGT